MKFPCTTATKYFILASLFTLSASHVCAQTATISSPTQNQVISNVYMSGGTNLSVTGTATGPGMANWILDYGSGTNPSTWTTINSGTTDVNNALLGTWNTKPNGTLLANGTFTLRLRVRDSNNNVLAQALRQVNLQHFKVGQSLTQFNGASGTQVTYSSTIPCLTANCSSTNQLTETLWIKNEAGQTIRTLVNAVPRVSNTFNDNWNATNDAGTLQKDGAYFYIASVTDGTNSMTWDLTNEFLTGNCEVYNNAFIGYTPFDPYDNIPLSATYNFTRPGRTTVKFWPCGSTYPGCTEPTCGGSYTLVNSKYEESGPHTMRWASFDNTGAYKVLPWGKIMNKVDSFSKNAVVLFGTKPAITNFKLLPPIFNPMRGTQEIKFDLSVYPYQSQTANITVTILNQKSSPPSILRTITTTSGSGTVSIVWNGKDDNNDKWLAQSSYRVRVSVTDSIIGNQIFEDLGMSIQY